MDSMDSIDGVVLTQWSGKVASTWLRLREGDVVMRAAGFSWDYLVGEWLIVKAAKRKRRDSHR